MKRKIWLLPLLAGLYACPYESAVPLSQRPVETVDTSLLGYWYGIVRDGSDYFGIEALDITQHSDSVYAITRYGKAIKGDIILPDTAYFTGHVSYVNGQRFMNCEGTLILETGKGHHVTIKREKVFYLSSITRSNDTLQVKTVSDNFSAQKSFKTPAALEQAVREALTTEKNIYDDVYMMSYRRIPKPAPVKSL